MSGGGEGGEGGGDGGEGEGSGDDSGGGEGGGGDGGGEGGGGEGCDAGDEGGSEREATMVIALSSPARREPVMSSSSSVTGVERGRHERTKHGAF